MVYVRIRDSGLPREQIAAVSEAFEEVCRLLSLSPREDALRDIVAEVVVHCAQQGMSDPIEMLKCAKEALRHAGSN